MPAGQVPGRLAAAGPGGPTAADSGTRAGPTVLIPPGPQNPAAVEAARLLAAPTVPGPAGSLLSLLPTANAARIDQVARALAWVVDNVDRPQVIATGAAQLGSAAAALGVTPERMEQLGMLLGEAVRAAGGPWTAQSQAAWQATGRLVTRWMAEGANAAAYEPPYWTAVLLERTVRYGDLAVLRLRSYLPYPYLAGQHALVETEHHREQWRPCWLATAPGTDNELELHVRADGDDPVGTALVGRVQPGDQVRLRAAEGGLGLALESGRDLLMVADDTGVAPMRALLGELAARQDLRQARLLWWTAPGEEPYDEAAVAAALADEDRLRIVGDANTLAAALAEQPWDEWDVAVAGTPTGVLAALTLLGFAGVAANRISVDQIGPAD